MEQVDVKFGEWIEKGFNLYKDNIGVLILATLLALLLSMVTLGILAGPMFGGVLLITLRMHDRTEPKPEVGDVFKGFDCFLQTFLFFLVWTILLTVAVCILSIVPCIGPILGIALGYATQAFLMFGLFLIVDKGMDFWPASMASFDKVKANFWPFLGLSVVASIIGGIGAIACGIGIIVTIPIQVCILAVAYRDVFGGAQGAVSNDAAPPSDAIQDQGGGPAE